MKKLTNFWHSHKIKIIVSIGFGILFSVIFSKLNRNSFVPNDDINFPEIVSQFSSVWSYLSNRLGTWSSRILPEIFTYFFSTASINYWRLTSVFVYITSVFLGYKLYKITSPKQNDKKDGVILSAIMGSLLLMGINVLDNYGAVYWFTGAMNYFWMTPFFLMALYAPVFILVKRKLPNKIWLAISLTATILTSISHEQFAMALIGILFFICIYFVVKNIEQKKELVWQLALLVISLIGFSVYFSVQGNDIRLEQEIVTWLPDLYSVPLAVRLESNIRWFFDAIINQTGYLLPIIWILTSILLLKNSKKISNVLAAVCLIVFSIFGLFADKFMMITIFLREFYPVWGFVGNLKDWIPIVVYLIILIITLVAIYFVHRDKKENSIAPIALAVIAAGTIGAICLSPTIYASEYRTLYVASILFMMIIIILLNKLLNNLKSPH
jgi:hypothetical protein